MGSAMKEESLPRKEREFIRHRREILECALELFSKNGFNSVTMNDIAAQSEFAVGTLYKFFRNKEDLYTALILEISDEFEGTLTRAIEDGKDEMDSIRGYVDNFIELFMKNLKFVRLYLAEARGASFNVQAGMDAELRKKYDRVLEKLAEVFKRGIRKKIFKDFDAYLLARGLDGIANAFLFQVLDHGDEHAFDTGTIMKMFFEPILSSSSSATGISPWAATSKAL